TITVEVVSPERVLWTGEATQVITRTLGGGEVAFLADHAPFLAALVENHTRIFLEDGSVQALAVHGGFVEVSNSKVSILSDGAELASEIDVERARAAKERAQRYTDEYDDANIAAQIARANARLRAAGQPVD